MSSSPLAPVVAFALASVLAGSARAQSPLGQTPLGTPAKATTPAPRAEAEAHPQLAFRSFGWSIPFGRTGLDQDKVSDLAAGTFPTILDLGMRVNRWLLVGLYLGFNYGVPSKEIADSCAEAVRCSVSSFRVGGQLQLYPWKTGAWRPWFGVGAGYESLSVLVDIPTPDGTSSRGIAVTLRGAELLNLLGGFEYHANDTFAVGPFLGLGLGAYSSAVLDTVNGLSVTERTKPALHGWATAGLRLSLFP